MKRWFLTLVCLLSAIFLASDSNSQEADGNKDAKEISQNVDAKNSDADLVKAAEDAYSQKDYNKALELLQKELSKPKPNPQAYEFKWELQMEMSKSAIEKEVKAVVEKLEQEKDAKRKEELVRAALFGFLAIDNKTSLFELAKKYPDNPAIDSLAQNEFEKTLGTQRWEMILPNLITIIENYPKSERVEMAYRSLLYVYLYALKNNELTENLLKKWIEAEPNNPLVYKMYARCLNDMNGLSDTTKEKVDDPAKKASERMETSLKMASKAIEISKNYKRKQDKNLPEFYTKEQDLIDKASYYDTYAWTLFKSGKYEEALKEIDKALAIIKGVEQFHFHKGKIYEKLGKDDDAIACYLEGLKIYGVNQELEKSLSALYQKQHQKNDYRPTFAKKELGNDAVLFTEVTHEAGLVVDAIDPKTGKPNGKKDYLRTHRVAIGDYNNDGLQDVLFTGSILYKNLGNGKFEDVTKASGLDKLSDGIGGATWGDYDNDGHLDFYGIYASSEDDKTPGHHDRLIRNRGDGTFEDVTEKAGKVYDFGPTQAAVWVDVNNDGWLDLYVANHERINYQVNGERVIGKAYPDYLWINQGNGTFVDETKKRGIVPPDGIDRCGRGLNCADFDNDGHQDIYVCNYRLNPNFLWKNDGKGFFKDVSKELGVKGIPGPGNYKDAHGHSLGGVWGDINNDGFLDLVIGNLAHPRFLQFSNPTFIYISSGAPDWKFTDVREKSGVKYEETHTDPSLVDYDNDGDLDLYLTCVYEGRKSFFYRNDGNVQFKDVTYLTGVRADDTWGSAWFDFDNDGDLDLITCSGTGGCRLFRNDGTPNNYLRVKLEGTASNRAAIGARLELTSGDKKQIREINAGRGYCSQDEMIAHFGLGKFDGKMSLKVKWPSGAESSLEIDKPNQTVKMKEPEKK